MFISLSQLGEEKNLTTSWIHVAFGIGLAILAAISNALSPAFGLRHGVDIHQRVLKATGQDIGEFNATLLSLGMMRTFATPIAILIAWLTNEIISTDILMAGVVAGIVAVGFANAGVLQANLKTVNLGINVLTYVRPIVSVFWIYLAAGFSLLSFPQVKLELFVIGAIAIIVANILVNFEASIRTAYKALIVGLWISGTVVGLGDPISVSGYPEIVASVATMFILLISFRSERLVRRTKEEEAITLRLASKLTINIRNERIMKQALACLEKLDKYHGRSAIQDTYKELQNLIQNNMDSITSREEAGDMLSETHQLAHSKQQGRGLGEFIALWLIGGLLIMVLLFFGIDLKGDIESGGWGDWMVAMVSFVIASTVLFLLFNVSDLEKDRGDQVIKDNQIIFKDVVGRQFERRLSWAMVVIIIALFAVLFGLRWVN